MARINYADTGDRYICQVATNEQGILTERFIEDEHLIHDNITNKWKKSTPSKSLVNVMNFVRSGPEREYASKSNVVSVLENIKAELNVDIDPSFSAWRFTDDGIENLSGEIISFTNGYIYVQDLLENGIEGVTLHDPTPAIFNYFTLDTTFDRDAKAPLFDTFINQIMPNKEHSQILLMIGGLILIPDTSYQVFFVLLGNGQNGKTVFTEILEALIGKDMCSHIPILNMGEQFGLSGIAGKLVNISNEIPTSQNYKWRVIADEILKMLCDGGLLRINEKFKAIFTCNNFARLIATVNHFPNITDDSIGMLRRLIVLPFEVTITKTERNNNLKNELFAEKSGILNRFLESLITLKKNHPNKFPETHAMEAIKMENREASDPLESFLYDHYEYCSDAEFIPSEVILHQYIDVCVRENIHYKPDARALVQKIKRIYPNAITGIKERITYEMADNWPELYPAVGKERRGVRGLSFRPNGDGVQPPIDV